MKSLRPFVAADAPILAGFMRDEGIADDEMVFAERPTLVLEEGGTVMGFFTLKMTHDVFPSVVHFAIGREYRTNARAWFLVRALRRTIRDAGFPRLIVHATTDELRRLLRAYFRARPYAEQDGRAYFVVTA